MSLVASLSQSSRSLLRRSSSCSSFRGMLNAGSPLPTTTTTTTTNVPAVAPIATFSSSAAPIFNNNNNNSRNWKDVVLQLLEQDNSLRSSMVYALSFARARDNHDLNLLMSTHTSMDDLFCEQLRVAEGQLLKRNMYNDSATQNSSSSDSSWSASSSKPMMHIHDCQ